MIFYILFKILNVNKVFYNLFKINNIIDVIVDESDDEVSSFIISKFLNILIYFLYITILI